MTPRIVRGPYLDLLGISLLGRPSQPGRAFLTSGGLRRSGSPLSKPRRRGRRGAGRFPESVPEPGELPRAVEVLHLAGTDRGERSAHALAPPASRAHGFAR